jgi:c(7)-type cytochrome triheme protein
MIPAGFSAGEKPFPIRLIVPTNSGGVVFYHFAHAQRENFDCQSCHKQWPQDAKTPLKFGPGGHASASNSHASCGSCHHQGGRAFAVEGNCAGRCHSMFAGRTATATRAGD